MLVFRVVDRDRITDRERKGDHEWKNEKLND